MFVSSLVVLLVVWRVAGSPAAYDQRQTGDVNVQIHLKDVQVVALVDTELLDDYTDYNYSYDYSDFTIKPITKPTTLSGPSTTVSPWHTWPTHPPTSPSTSNKTTEASNSTSSLSSSSTSPNSTTSSVASSTEAAGDLLALEREEASTKPGAGGRCGQRDSKGRCRKPLRKRLSLLPLALRMLPRRPESAPVPPRI